MWYPNVQDRMIRKVERAESVFQSGLVRVFMVLWWVQHQNFVSGCAIFCFQSERQSSSKAGLALLRHLAPAVTTIGERKTLAWCFHLTNLCFKLDNRNGHSPVMRSRHASVEQNILCLSSATGLSCFIVHAKNTLGTRPYWVILLLVIVPSW